MAACWCCGGEDQPLVRLLTALVGLDKGRRAGSAGVGFGMAMNNKMIAGRLAQMAQMLELLGEDRFRINAHARAARAIGEQTADVCSLDRKQLLAIDGIGAKMADKIIAFAGDGKIAEFDELAVRVPAGLLAVLELQGLGPKTVKQLWDQLGVERVDDLKRVINDGSILELPRMGAKTVQNIERALAFASSSAGRLALGMAMPIAERIVATLNQRNEVSRAAYAGSIRRGRDTTGDIDVLVCSSDPEKTMEAFCSLPGMRDVLVRGVTKVSLMMEIDSGLGRWDKNKDKEGKSGTALKENGLQVDLRLVPEESWGAALLYFSGSREHNVELREQAIKKGLTLNEYGLFKDDGKPGTPMSKGCTPLASRTEQDIYKALGMAWLAPEVREDRGELEPEAMPELIRFEDIQAELHAHTKASDGLLTLDELIECARARGFHTIAVTDHSQSSTQAGGLSPARLHEQIQVVHEARQRYPDMQILAGSEVDILADGRLDYDDELLSELDIVVASPHTALSQDTAAATKRLIRAVTHPLVHILGHPTGRLINKRNGLEPRMDEVFAAATEHNTALEINSHWMRLDLRDNHVRAALQAGCLIAIDCDVHALEDFENLKYGVMTGRRGWLEAERCVNTWDAKRLGEWLADKRG